MSVSEDVASLADELQRSPFSVRTEIQALPSGEIWLDIHHAGQLFNFVYLAREQCFGVDKYSGEEDGLSTHFRFSFDDFQSAKAKLLSMLAEAGFQDLLRA
jgi:hypothetical protein